MNRQQLENEINQSICHLDSMNQKLNDTNGNEGVDPRGTGNRL